jgi:hypothetical protein
LILKLKHRPGPGGDDLAARFYFWLAAQAEPELNHRIDVPGSTVPGASGWGVECGRSRSRPLASRARPSSIRRHGKRVSAAFSVDRFPDIGLASQVLPSNLSGKPHYEEVPGFIGAGERNRTAVISLEGFCSTIELHPRAATPSLTGK